MTTQAAPLAGKPRRQPSHARGRASIGYAILGVVGELLITAGVLLGLYVVWQLFYTDVQSARVQQAELDKIEWAEEVRVPRAAVAPPGEEPSPEQIQLIPDELKVYSPKGAPVITEPAEGTTYGVLHVPRWGFDYSRPISEGTDRHRVLDKLGIGHYSGTAMPGQVGNFAIAGHRTTYGKPFTDIDQLAVGDALVVQTEQAWYVYKVTAAAIVLPEQVEVIAPVPSKPNEIATAASITLTSCHPKFSAEKRYVVWGELEYWAPTGHGYPAEIVEQS